MSGGQNKQVAQDAVSSNSAFRIQGVFRGPPSAKKKHFEKFDSCLMIGCLRKAWKRRTSSAFSPVICLEVQPIFLTSSFFFPSKISMDIFFVPSLSFGRPRLERRPTIYRSPNRWSIISARKWSWRNKEHFTCSFDYSEFQGSKYGRSSS